MKWIKEIVSTDDAPEALGPYSQGVCAGPLLFISGQLGLNPAGNGFAGATMEKQTKQAMENIAAVLDAGGSSLDQILKVTVYLDDINDLKSFNDAYSLFFEGDPPARAVIETSRLPLGALVEIDVIALRD